MLRTIPVGLDRSRESRAAAEWAAREATLRDLPLRIVHIREPEPEPIAQTPLLGAETHQHRTERISREAAEGVSLRHPGVEVISEHLSGSPHDVLAEAVKGAELLVLGSRLPIVVGVDGSEPSLRAVDWAADEAALRGAQLRLVYASLWERYEGAAPATDLGKPSEQIMAEDIVRAAAQRARTRQADIRISTSVLPEEPEYALVREGRNAAALVLGTRGRSGLVEMLLGSVSLAVATHADCPVIVLRGSHDNQVRTATHGRVVVGIGETGTEPAALRFAVQEARLRDATLDAVRAWRCPAHETTDHPLLAGEPAWLHEQHAADVLEEALKEVPADVELRRRTIEGPARRVLLAASHEADLLVVGARRNPGHLGLQLGRVAHAALHHAACAVAVVPERG
ncbi:universal stress protein [Streptomyces sp. NPDC001315]|uniref:universal stress protein n=1 Tax=Streptomyces sp. NPDC001315 TaxID=3364562 RepID=UPI0036B221C3